LDGRIPIMHNNKIMEPFYKFKINAVFEKDKRDKRKGLPLKA
jgi:hypothetical protein